jgi:hypothetical protein
MMKKIRTTTLWLFYASKMHQKKNFRIKKFGALYVKERFKPRPFMYTYHIMLEYKQRLFYMHDDNDFGAFEIIKLT